MSMCKQSRKSDREKALETFGNWTPNVVAHKLTAREMRAVYNRSQFVVVGRGWTSLDCFRVYEALIAGAVPIVVV